MSRLKDKDVANVIECLRDVYSLTDIATFGEQVISKLRAVLLCDGILFGTCDVRTMRSEFVADHPDASRLALEEIITNLPSNQQHPYWPYYLRSGDPRATKLSDFLSRREFHSKGFYTELYKPLKAEVEIGCMLQIAPPSRMTYIAAIRDGRDFTERDRLVLNLLQPHLSQAYRNATALSTLRAELRLARVIVDSLDRGVIVRSRGGDVGSRPHEPERGLTNTSRPFDKPANCRRYSRTGSSIKSCRSGDAIIFPSRCALSSRSVKARG